MKLGIVLDIAMLILMVYGYTKGYKKGIVLMAIPTISFLVGLVLMKPIGVLMYTIFGEGIENAFESLLIRKLDSSTIASVVMEQIVNEKMIENMLEILMFVILYIIASAVVTSIFTATRLRVNSSAINNADKIVGGFVGIVQELMMVLLVLTIVYVLFKFNFAGNETFASDLIDTSFVTRFIYRINPITKILSL